MDQKLLNNGIRTIPILLNLEQSLHGGNTRGCARALCGFELGLVL
jgi:hypothetical protein